ncbi:MAG TPA: DMT family transporter, partial [Symbiobacteriaceae bacterium]|nr:DMT family transporter [Symbiobacteriaceae bacterium]
MTPRQILTLLVLSAFWGGSFIFMRVAAPELGPIVLIELRVLIAGLALLAYGAVSRTLQPLGPAWKQFLVIGAINSAIPFLLIATASLYLPASVTATLNATTPLFGAAAAAAMLGERLTLRKGAGILLGIVGV